MTSTTAAAPPSARELARETTQRAVAEAVLVRRSRAPALRARGSAQEEARRREARSPRASPSSQGGVEAWAPAPLPPVSRSAREGPLTAQASPRQVPGSEPAVEV